MWVWITHIHSYRKCHKMLHILVIGGKRSPVWRWSSNIIGTPSRISRFGKQENTLRERQTTEESEKRPWLADAAFTGQQPLKRVLGLHTTPGSGNWRIFSWSHTCCRNKAKRTNVGIYYNDLCYIFWHINVFHGLSICLPMTLTKSAIENRSKSIYPPGYYSIWGHTIPDSKSMFCCSPHRAR